MVDALVFSRDRPMQLEACLRSLGANAPYFVPHVLYKATSPAYEDGYRLIEADMHPEDTFRRDALDTLARCGPHVLLLCDDSITYRPLPADPVEAMTEDVLCFSLRLGENTTYCHPRNLWHSTPDLASRGPFRVWEWQHAEGDFGYPHSVDGVVHRRDNLLQRLTGEFSNPNTMEDALGGMGAGGTPLMACYSHSVQVGLPHNTVNETHQNRESAIFAYDPATLNAMFLDGVRIRYEDMDFSAIRGAHEEVELLFTDGEREVA